MESDEIAKIKALGRAAAFVVHHEKFAGISQLAAWMWLAGLVHTMEQQTKGVISEQALKKLAPGKTGPRRAAWLVDAGLWRPLPGGGWKMLALSSKAPTKKTAPTASDPVGTEFLKFETIGEGPGFWMLSEEQVTLWTKLYPSVDVKAQCGYALAWVNANPTRRKTVRGMPRFLVRWLTNSVNQRQGSGSSTGTARGRTGAAPAGKYDNLQATDAPDEGKPSEK